MAQSFKIFLFYHDFTIQQYYFVSINQDMDLKGEVNDEPHGLLLENGHQDSDSEGSSNYTVAPTHPAMPPPPNETFQTREELVSGMVYGRCIQRRRLIIMNLPQILKLTLHYGVLYERANSKGSKDDQSRTGSSSYLGCLETRVF